MGAFQIHTYPPRYGAFPRLRRVQAREVEEGGRRLFAVCPAEGAAGEELLLTPEALAIASFFDGEHDLRDVQREISRQYGQLLYVERIHSLAQALHNAGLFERPGPPPFDVEEETEPGDETLRADAPSAAPAANRSRIA